MAEFQSQCEAAASRLMDLDQQQGYPVIKTMSLEFWNRFHQWLNRCQDVPRPFIIGIGGPSGSGKSYLCQLLADSLQSIVPVTTFSQDNYYRDFEADFPHIPLSEFYHQINLDDPNHFRLDALADDLNAMRSAELGNTLPIHQLQYGTPDRKPTLRYSNLKIPIAPVIITEGIHAFYNGGVRQAMDLKIFMDIDEGQRRARWIARNQEENRGTTDNMWNTTVMSLEQDIRPTCKHADIIINNNISTQSLARFVNQTIKTFHSLWQTAPYTQEYLSEQLQAYTA